MRTKAEGHRLRRGRVSEPGRIYLITAVCHNRAPHFGTLHHGRCFVQAIRSVRTDAATLSYVVMPDHVHWLMQLGEGADLPGVVQKAKSLTTRAMRRHYGTVGPIWQRGFHDRAVRKDEDIRALARYIVANPLRAGIVVDIGRYPLWDAVWL